MDDMKHVPSHIARWFLGECINKATATIAAKEAE